MFSSVTLNTHVPRIKNSVKPLLSFLCGAVGLLNILLC